MSIIYVSGVDEMPDHVADLGIAYLVSVIQSEFQPPTPRGIDARLHHRVMIHDIVEPRPQQVLASDDDVAGLIDFLSAWPMDAPLLAHCYAGVSRSTATALIARVVKGGSPEDSARLLRRQAPHAMPNSHIIGIADRLLDLDGRLIDAVRGMGRPADAVLVAPLTVLPVGE